MAMSYSYAYQATTPNSALKHIIVNSEADKLVITKMDNDTYSTLDSRLPQFEIYWSNVSKFDVDQLHGGYTTRDGELATTRQYHFEFVDMTLFSDRFKAIVGPKGKFCIEITDKRQGTSLLFDVIDRGCLGKMNFKGDFQWTIFKNQMHSNICPAFGTIVDIGASHEIERMRKAIENNMTCRFEFQ